METPGLLQPAHRSAGGPGGEDPDVDRGGANDTVSRVPQRSQPKENPVRKYVIERSLPGVGRFGPKELREAAERSNEALARLAPDVQWVQSYVTDDATYCVYLALDEERVRRHAALSGFPATRITEVRTTIDPSTATAAIPAVELGARNGR